MREDVRFRQDAVDALCELCQLDQPFIGLQFYHTQAVVDQCLQLLYAIPSNHRLPAQWCCADLFLFEIILTHIVAERCLTLSFLFLRC
jgi:hypothetical protein